MNKWELMGFDAVLARYLQEREEQALLDARRDRESAGDAQRETRFRDAPEWSRFAVGEPSDREGWTENSCRPLESIFHVAHLHVARRILEDGQIRAGLVFDESVLRTQRIRVCWLSPNYWYPGFRYGNVRFKFEWLPLLEGMDPYWVEAIDHYNPTACRILLSDRDESSWLTPYDPSQGDGPWWYDTENDQHYWNGEYTLEVMIRGDITARDCVDVDLVKHHETYCSIHPNSPSTCDNLGKAEADAEAEFLAMVVAEGIDPAPLAWVEWNEDMELEARFVLQSASTSMCFACRRGDVDYGGPLAFDDAKASSVAHAVLAAVARRDETCRQELMGLFRSEADALRVIDQVTAHHFGLSEDALR